MIRTRSALAVLASITLMGATAAWPQSDWKAPAAAKTLKNPVQGVGDARNVIATSCAACHGSSGRGDGVASAALQPKPADWTSTAVQNDTDGELFWRITNGRGAMPAWRQLPESERWQIVNYIRTLKK
jgi:mono/diheme cytochrome c family protein